MPAITLLFLPLTQPTITVPTGAATIEVQGGNPPLTQLYINIPGVTAGTVPMTSAAVSYYLTFTGIAPATYTYTVTDDAGTTPLVGTFTINPVPAPVAGCTDEYATNYDPAADTESIPSTCTYAPQWRSAWGPTNMAVRVAAVPGQTAAYIAAELFIGFRPGHPNLIGFGSVPRPYGDPIPLRATVGPDGFATFKLGPFVQPAIGTADGLGGYRLDLNDPQAPTIAFYIGYELRRTTGELLEYGYAANTAVSDAELAALPYLRPFVRLPIWPQYQYDTAGLTTAGSLARYGVIEQRAGSDNAVLLPCPPQPLPVAWLAPQGFGYWVFRNHSEKSDIVEDGQAYSEALTGERRWVRRGEARKVITASTGVFKGVDLLEGLRTLWRSTQVWYQPVKDGPWIPVTLEAGTFPAGRTGVARTELKISFTEAAATNVQGQ